MLNAPLTGVPADDLADIALKLAETGLVIRDDFLPAQAPPARQTTARGRQI